jgi:Na+/proline symporter
MLAFQVTFAIFQIMTSFSYTVTVKGDSSSILFSVKNRNLKTVVRAARYSLNWTGGKTTISGGKNAFLMDCGFDRFATVTFQGSCCCV